MAATVFSAPLYTTHCLLQNDVVPCCHSRAPSSKSSEGGRDSKRLLGLKVPRYRGPKEGKIISLDGARSKLGSIGTEKHATYNIAADPPEQADACKSATIRPQARETQSSEQRIGEHRPSPVGSPLMGFFVIRASSGDFTYFPESHPTPIQRHPQQLTGYHAVLLGLPLPFLLTLDGLVHDYR